MRRATSPLINLGLDVLRSQDVLLMDETVTLVLKEEGRSARQQSRMWIMNNNTDQHTYLSNQWCKLSR